MALLLLSSDTAAPIPVAPTDYTYATACVSLIQAFVDGWGATTPIHLDAEQPFTPPAPTLAPATPAAWVRCVLRHLDRRQQTLAPPGARRWERVVMVIVQIFIQTGRGTELAEALAEQANAIFEGVEIGGIECYKADIIELGADGKGWYQVNVQTRARYQQTK